jgi:hypothetical protein
MELAGKYLIATIKDQSARLLFDLPGAARSDRHWTFVGRVSGETAGVGVWLAIEEIVNPEFDRKITDKLQGICGAYQGRERNWGIKRSGLCLLVAWTAELLKEVA